MRRVPCACSATIPASFKSRRCRETAGRLIGKRRRDLVNGLVAVAQQPKDLTSSGVPQRLEGIPARFRSRHADQAPALDPGASGLAPNCSNERFPESGIEPPDQPQ